MNRLPALCFLLAVLAAPAAIVAQTGESQVSESARACFAAGDSMRDGKPAAEAVTACSAAIAEQPDDASLLAALLTERGVAYREQRDFARALVDFDAALRLQPGSLPHANLRAWAYRELGNFEAAERAYSQILQQESARERVAADRAIWQAFLSRCVVRLDLGWFQLALGDCVTALQGSRNSDSLYFAARAYTELKRCGEAVPLLEEALLLEPVMARIYQELGYALICSGERRRGVTVLDQGLALYPDDPGLREMRRWAASF